MSNVVFSEKRHCPMCYYTNVTTETHCPKIAEYPQVHEYRISVPLVTSAPDTSNQHKYEKVTSKRNHKPDPNRVDRIIGDMNLLQGKCKPNLELIRMMQKRARKNNVIKDNHFD